MCLNRYTEFKGFLSMYKIEEHIFHRACNNFLYMFLETNEKFSLQENENKDFYLILSGKLKAFYERDSHADADEYENSFAKRRRELDILPIQEDNFMERVISVGDYFGEKIKYKGYILRSVEAIEDVNLIYLTEEIFDKVFSAHMIRFEKQIRNALLKNIGPLCELGNKRYQNFLNSIDTMVIK